VPPTQLIAPSGCLTHLPPHEHDLPDGQHPRNGGGGGPVGHEGQFSAHWMAAMPTPSASQTPNATPANTTSTGGGAVMAAIRAVMQPAVAPPAASPHRAKQSLPQTADGMMAGAGWPPAAPLKPR